MKILKFRSHILLALILSIIFIIAPLAGAQINHTSDPTESHENELNQPLEADDSQTNTQTGAESSTQPLTINHDDLTKTLSELNKLVDETPNFLQRYLPIISNFEYKNNNYQKNRDFLANRFEQSNNHPMVQQDILNQMNEIKENLSDELMVVKNEINDTTMRLKTIEYDGNLIKNAYQNDLDIRNKYPLPEKYQEILNDLTIRKNELEQIKTPAQNTLDEFQNNITAFKRGLTEEWKEYYLTPSKLFSINQDTISNLHIEFSDFFNSFYQRMEFMLPQTLTEWTERVLPFALIMAMMIVLRSLLRHIINVTEDKHEIQETHEKIIVYILKKTYTVFYKIGSAFGVTIDFFSRKLAKITDNGHIIEIEEHDDLETYELEKPVLPEHWRKAIKLITTGPWIFLTLGISLVYASHRSLGGTYSLLLLPGVLFIIWGLASVSWMLRVTVQRSKEEHDNLQEITLSKETQNFDNDRHINSFHYDKLKLKDKNSPLRRFFLPAALGVVLLFLDIPSESITVVWFVVMSLLLRKLWKLSKKNKEKHKKFPALERFCYGSAIPFSIISLLCSIIGYARFSILIFMLLFTFVNILILGYAFMELGVILSNHIFSKDQHPIKNTILNSFVAPLTWAISLLTALPWLKAIPGSIELLQYFFAKSITIGANSVTYTNLLIVPAIYILFRSLKKSINDSLDHVKTTTNRRKLITPAQLLLPFVIWSIFFITSLGILGVNLTGVMVVLGSLGVGIGLAFQDLFRNIVSGLILIFGGSIKVEDWIQLDELEGEVTNIDIYCTSIDTPSHARVMIPNSSLITNRLINWSKNGRKVRKPLSVQIYYGTDIHLALSLLVKTALKDKENILTFGEDAPLATLNTCNERAQELHLWVTVKDIRNVIKVMSNLLVNVEKCFDKHGIKFYHQSLDISLAELPVLKEVTR
jgi:small-conductance mechanosensitive channel